MKNVCSLLAVSFLIAASFPALASEHRATDLLAAGVDAIKHEDWAHSAAVTRAALDLPDLSPTQEIVALNNLCIALSRLPDFDEALGVCNQAIETAPERWSAYVNRGNLKASIGRIAAAHADYAMAKSLNPNQEVSDLALMNMHLGSISYFSALVPPAGADPGIQRAEAK